MSFITKRERVFNEYNLFDLPARNEGKLKAYASCTDARAWSHFCSDKTEHLVEIIKRNNEKCRPKYVPIEVIVNTLMIAKNTQISRLKRKIEEFEQMLAAYDLLELTEEQKAEIANAHASIKAANKELDDLCLDLNLSGFTEGIDSEAFETGKSRGDEASRSITETDKSTISEWSYTKVPRHVEIRNNKNDHDRTQSCDASTCAYDPRIEELQDMIVSKDAKLNAMQNTIAVLENDVCEPYCIYAQIYTALEKIFGILRQNLKYRQYLDLLTLGKNIQHIHVKGKILFKIKILEKFSLALIAPCSQDSESQDCSCYCAEIMTSIETTYALTATENCQSILDNKRSHLVADIIGVEEIKDILSKEKEYETESENINECYSIDECNISKVNINRLKNLQSNYDDLIACYENLKYEKDHLYVRCQTLLKKEDECEVLQNKLKEYNNLWNEKEYFRKRSDDLDKLREFYYLLLEETSNLESKFKAESEINKAKSDTVNELQKENILLEKKLNEKLLLFEKEKNAIVFKLKEAECNIMCKEQEIKSLSNQIEKLLEENTNMLTNKGSPLVELLDEIAMQKEEIINLRETCKCNEDEKLYLQEEFHSKLELISELKFEVESWKSKYEDSVRMYEILNSKIKFLSDENQVLHQQIDEKTNAVDNLHNIIRNKSEEIENLTEELEQKNNINKELSIEIYKIRNDFKKKLIPPEKEEKIIISDHDEKSKSSHDNEYAFNSNENKYVSNTSSVHEDIVLPQIQLLRQESTDTVVKYMKEQYKNSLQLSKKESVDLENKLLHSNKLDSRIEQLENAYQTLLQEKKFLENDLGVKTNELRNLNKNYQRIHHRLQESELYKEKYEILRTETEKKLNDNEAKINEFRHKNTNLESEKESLLIKCQTFDSLNLKLNALKLEYDKLTIEKNNMEIALSEKTKELNSIIKKLQSSENDNKVLLTQIKALEFYKESPEIDMSSLKDEKLSIPLSLDALKLEHDELMTEKGNIKTELIEKTKELNTIIKQLEDSKNENTKLLTQTKALEIYEKSSKNDIASLKDEILSLRLSLNGLKLECDNLMTQKDDISIELNEKTGELNSIMKQLEDSRNENTTLLAEIKTLEFHEYSCKNDISALKDENLSLRLNLEALKLECDKLRTEKDHIKIELSEKTEELNSIKQQLQDSNNENTKLLTQIKALEFYEKSSDNDISSLKDENISIHLSLNALKLKCDKLMKEKDNIKIELLEKTKELNSTNQQLQDSNNENTKLLAQIKALEFYEKSSDNDISSWKDENISIRLSLDALKLECNNHMIEKDNIKIELLEKTKELNNIIKQLEDNKNENMKLMAQIKTLEFNGNSSKNDTSALNDENLSLRLSLEALKLKCDKLMTEKDNIKIELLEKTKELNSINQQLQDSNNDNTKLLAQIKALEFYEKSSDNDISSLKDENISIHLSLNALKLKCDKLMKEKDNIKIELLEKTKELNSTNQQLQDSNNENTKLLAQIKALEFYEKSSDNDISSWKDENISIRLSLDALKLKYDKLMTEKDNIKIELLEKTKELNSINQQLQDSNNENTKLLAQIKGTEFYEKSFKNDISSLKDENLSMRLKLDALNKENIETNNKLIHYKNIETEHNNLIIDNDQIKKENEKLRHDFSIHREVLKTLENENKEIKTQIHLILTEKETLGKMLEKKQEEVISANSFYADIKQEIDSMKKEKNCNEEKILDLMNKLQRSEQLILNLKDDVFKRDNTISELQNHINNLQEEIKELHKNLEIAIENGEDICKESFVKIDESVGNVEAHYSKATHNMKAELAKLQEKHDALKNQYPTTTLNLAETDVKKHRYISQVMHLQNERKKIILNLNQLEIKTLGYSTLTTNSTAEDIVEVLNNIRKVIDDKNTYYEQKLLNNKNSYQLLKSKAEEAKTIVELEKQKIVNEKETSKKERINIERKLLDMHQQLKDQEVKYTDIIKEMEAKLLDQRLIYDQIQESKESHINKLKEEILRLKEIYEKSIVEIEVLRKKMQDSQYEKKTQNDQINKLSTDYGEKSTEIKMLQKLLENIKNKTTYDVQLQTEFIIQVNSSIQVNEKDIQEKNLLDNTTDQQMKPNMVHLNTHNEKINKRNNTLNSSELSKNDVPFMQNKVQILTANVEPSLDFVKNIYQNYKLKRLQTKTLEQCSVSSLIGDFKSNNNNLYDFDNNVPQNPNEFRSVMSHNHSNKLKSQNVVDTIRPDNFKNENSHEEKTQNSSDKTQNLHHHTERAVEKESSFVNYLRNKVEKSNEADLRTTNTNKHDFSSTQNIDKHNEQKNTLQAEFTSSTEVSNSDEISPVIFPDYPVSDKDRKLTHESKLDTVELPSVEASTPLIVISSVNNITSQESLNIFKSPNSSNNSIKNLSTNEIIQNNPLMVQQSKDLFISKDKKYKKPKTKHELILYKPHIKNSKPNFKTAEKLVATKINTSFNALSIIETFGQIKESIDQPKATKDKKYNTKHSKTLLVRKNSDNSFHKKKLRRSQSYEQPFGFVELKSFEKGSPIIISSAEIDSHKKLKNRGILVKLDKIEDYEKKIKELSKALEAAENEYKKKIEAIKIQYENHVKCILNDHNQGVIAIQTLHEETISDIIKIHETEIENLRSISIDAMTKAEKLEIENNNLKFKLETRELIGLDQKPTKLAYSEPKKRKYRSRPSTTFLTKTNIEAFNVKPKVKTSGPCTCSLNINISDTIRNIFEKVDEGQTKLAEQTYLKYIANKLIDNIESLSARELSFLHLKVCRIWKTKLTKEEALKWKIDTLESELTNKQRQTQKRISELDRKVIKERRKLREVRKTICGNSASESQASSSQHFLKGIEKNNCDCGVMKCNNGVEERCSAGDPTTSSSATRLHRRGRTEIHRAALAQLDADEQQRRKTSNVDTSTHLRSSQDCHCRTSKKSLKS